MNWILKKVNVSRFLFHMNIIQNVELLLLLFFRSYNYKCIVRRHHFVVVQILNRVSIFIHVSGCVITKYRFPLSSFVYYTHPSIYIITDWSNVIRFMVMIFCCTNNFVWSVHSWYSNQLLSLFKLRDFTSTNKSRFVLHRDFSDCETKIKLVAALRVHDKSILKMKCRQFEALILVSFSLYYS